MTSFTCIHTNGVYQQYKGNICNRAFKCGSELPEYVALILRNGGSQSPDRWLRELRNNHQTERRFDFSVAGIVLIDEIETHLHLELQRKILDLLTSIFPNIQFIMSTHSPFIINSVDNAVIYDLEKKLLVKDGLSDVPYTGIVEGYFNANEMSVLLQKKFDRYKELANKEKLTEEDFDEIAELEMYLNEVPDYLALNLTTEYQRLKEGLRSREDI